MWWPFFQGNFLNFPPEFVFEPLLINISRLAWLHRCWLIHPSLPISRIHIFCLHQNGNRDEPGQIVGICLKQHYITQHSSPPPYNYGMMIFRSKILNIYFSLGGEGREGEGGLIRAIRLNHLALSHIMCWKFNQKIFWKFAENISKRFTSDMPLLWLLCETKSEDWSCQIGDIRAQWQALGDTSCYTAIKTTHTRYNYQLD